MKWLAVAAVVIVAVLVVLWTQLGRDEVIPTATAAKATAPAPATPSERAREERAAAAERAAVAKASEPAPPTPPGAPAKIDPMSDDFQLRFQDVVPKRLGQAAAPCYEGVAKRVHRNENVVFDFREKVKDGVVTIYDVKVHRSTISQPALETCFAQAIARVTWRDDTLPDWDGEDQMTISPERGLKKFMQVGADDDGGPTQQGYAIAPGHAPLSGDE